MSISAPDLGIRDHPRAASPAQTGKSGLKVADIEVRNRVLLAPMSGVTDEPFRDLAQQWNAGLTVTEMVASRELVRERPRDIRRARSSSPNSATATAAMPHVVQLAGCEAHWMAEGARIAEGLGADIIDINMGCPAREVTGRLSGSALMREPDHALSLIEATVAAVKVPVTLKMRMGWDHNSLNAPDIAKRAESAGVRMITVHGRTRCQFFKGQANWSFIAEVKQAVRVPVIANGDVRSVADAQRILEVSGADGVMIGRGAYGAPWLLGRIAAVLAGESDPGDPTAAVQARMVHAHYDAMLAHYGRELGMRNARKHLGWYVERVLPATPGVAMDRAKRWRALLCREEQPERVHQHISALFSETTEMAA
jgi:tRNA-dihydrouridine synthase B